MGNILGNKGITERELKLVCTRSFDKCPFPNCNQLLVQHDSIVGQIAHIVSPEENGPRADPSFPRDMLNRADNLLMLCPIHHKIVDDNDGTYTVSELKNMRENHIRSCHHDLQDAIQQVGFSELEPVIKHLISSPEFNPVEDYRLISIKEKLKKNKLSDRVEHEMSLGLLKVNEVRDYIQVISKADPLFSERLVSAFVKKYKELKTQDRSSDDIFYSLRAYAEGPNPNYSIRAASLSVITYLFECCEVFEK